MTDIELRPWQLTNDPNPPDNAIIITDRSDYVEPLGTTKAQWFANDRAAVAAADAAIKAGAGLTVTGAMPSSPTSTFLRDVDFLNAGYTLDEYHSLLLLDAAINTLALTGELNVIMTLTNAELLALFTTPVKKMATPTVGTFYHITKVLVKNTFVSVAYSCNAAGIVARFVGGTDPIVTMSQAFVQHAGPNPLIKKIPVVEHEITLSAGIEFWAPVSNPITGDGFIQVIFRYQLLPNFTGLSVQTSPCCIFPMDGTFATADLTALGNLEIQHNLNTKSIKVFIMDNNEHSSQYDFDLGTEAGADKFNCITVPISGPGVPITGTWTYMIIAIL